MQVSHLSKSSKGFTLIELIVVIAILAVLAAVSAPAILSHLEDAKRSAALKTCADIVQAVSSFSQDNGGAMPYLPNKVRPDGKDQIQLETAGGRDADMIKILTNREDDDDSRLNTMKEYYLRSDETEDKLKGGLYVDPDTDAVELYDPWGVPFRVVICEENEGCIDPYTKKRLRGKNCIVYSLGPDKTGLPGKRKTVDNEALEDNVYSWKKRK